MKRTNDLAEPWLFLEEYRGRYFNGEWPTLKEMFDITVLRNGDRDCFEQFVPKKWTLTYNEVQKLVSRIADYLLSKGVKKGDKVAVTGKNSVEWGLCYLGIAYAGCTIVPLDNAMHDDELMRILQFAEVKHVFCDADRYDRLHIDGTCIESKLCLEVSRPEEYVLNNLPEKSYEPYKLECEDIQAILFTSGTTGTPKGVMLTNRNLVSDCYQAQGRMNIYNTDVFYAILPIHHAYTMLAVLVETLSVGAKVVFGKRLVISQVLKELKQGKVTMFLAVPMLFNKMIAALMDGVRKKGIIVYGFIRGLMGISGFIKKVFNVNVGKKMFGFLLRKLSLEDNRICICGGGPLPASTFKLFNELGIDFVQGYGLTETSPITHLNPIYAYDENSVGRLIPGIEHKVVDPDEDGNGVIYIRGSVVMKGYYKNPEATAEVLDEDGWLNTGDVGHINEKDYLFLTGRAKNLIVTEGGKNVFPEEIEDHFQLYNDVEQICIIPYFISKEDKKEGIRALVYPAASLRDSGKSKEEIEKAINDIVTEVNKTLQSYKKITRVTVTDEPLEMTSTKKIKRFVVMKQYQD